MFVRVRIRPAVFALPVIALAILLAPAGVVKAHCDGLDGPVVSAAHQAIETKNVDLILVWVQPADEATIREAFVKTQAVRGLSPEARDLADMYLFETLVRVHRAGEGVPYTGLKPAGRDLGPAVPAADKAVASGDLEPVTRLLLDDVQKGLDEKFAGLTALRPHREHNVEAGREFIHAYVEFLHYVEGLHLAATGSDSGHAVDEDREQIPEAPLKTEHRGH